MLIFLHYVWWLKQKLHSLILNVCRRNIYTNYIKNEVKKKDAKSDKISIFHSMKTQVACEKLCMHDVIPRAVTKKFIWIDTLKNNI